MPLATVRLRDGDFVYVASASYHVSSGEAVIDELTLLYLLHDGYLARKGEGELPMPIEFQPTSIEQQMTLEKILAFDFKPDIEEACMDDYETFFAEMGV